MAHDTAPPSSGNEALVCVVDQDAATRDSLERLLGTFRLQVRTFTSADSFLSEAADLTLMCLISEVDLPDMNGVELLRRLAAHGIDVPTILMANESDVPTAVDAMQAGAVDFFEKPLVARHLLARVHQILQRRLLN